MGDNDEARIDFVRGVIGEHVLSDMYKVAQIADDYDRQCNTTIMAFQRALFNLQGKPVDDLWSANYKLASNFFRRFVTQQNQFLLGNGVTWSNEETAAKLGDDFDTQLQKAGRAALVGACSYVFFNLDHVEVFTPLEYTPLVDEETGAQRAGVRHWQIDRTKPLRATLFEEDGYTDFIWTKGKGSILHEKRPYVQTVQVSAVDGTEYLYGTNYPSYPIVPLWGNPHHQSELIGIRAQIDAYDIIKSGFADDLDSAQVYWILHNAGGMDDTDLAQFIERLHIVHAAAVDDAAGTAVDSHTVDIPHEAREKLLDRISADLYRDYMALDTERIASGAATATQIRAAYEPVNSKADEYEYCVREFLDKLLAVAGIDDKPTFTRSIMVNVQEEVQTLVQAASYLSAEYVTTKIMTIFGDIDLVEEELAKQGVEERARFGVNEWQTEDTSSQKKSSEESKLT